VPRLQRPDGVELHWEQRGQGPLVVVTSYWSMHPDVFAPLADELSGDHRLVRYDDRGAGESTRAGPYDLDTSAGDLEAVIEAADGGPAVIVAMADGPHRAVRVAAGRPDLVDAVVAVGGPPISRAALVGSEAMASSDAVVGALLEMAGTDYRSALRSTVGATNPQLSEEELRDRVRRQAEYSPAEAAVPRLRAWAEGDSTDQARAIGDRLWIVHAEQLSGGWFPQGPALVKLAGRLLPEARLEQVDDGLVSRPEQTAAIVRKVTSRARAASG
jgi:pimeloyl-ACP methyl ester carboxylesterase